MPKISSRSAKPAAGRARKTAASKKKPAAAAKRTKSRGESKTAPVEPTAVATPLQPIVPPLPVAEVQSLTPRRRAVFIDVENTSSEDALIHALAQLVIDRQATATDVVAVGNWRVISHQVARMLAQRGARLLHSAPATGVKDWSDLAIAVHAGIWLGRSTPGDVIDLVSADRAFDAVADAAMSLGVIFRRHTYGAVRRVESESDDDNGGRRGRRRRGRRGGRRVEGPAPTPIAAVHARPSSPPPAPAPAREEPRDEDGFEEDHHSASHQQIIAAVARLTAKEPERGVNLDLLINALKSEGFSRPPGSPRLVTRLRKMKDIQVSSTGMVRLAGAAAPGPAVHAEPVVEPPVGEAETEAAEVPAEKPAPRSRRGGGSGGTRRRSRSGGRRSSAKAKGGDAGASAEASGEGGEERSAASADAAESVVS